MDKLQRSRQSNSFIKEVSKKRNHRFKAYKIIYLDQILVSRNFFYIKTFELSHIVNLDQHFCFGGNIRKHNLLFYIHFCGSTSLYDKASPVDLYAYHQNPTAQIIITGETLFWGIVELQLFIEKCPNGCDSYDENGCLNQILYIPSKSFTYIDLNEGWQYDIISYKNI
ncbi:unnamed protein product [Paramecium sonneborni]|uniref:Uncharacterized protein n=1 Tax=Paramecium sonneborni TaxID=65129 RepID=A0A8S1RR20_9CILI|nr:unnamed protein product [Paramecium sonneborni]